MTHAETLAKAEAWRRGELSHPEQAEFQGHLKACSACRELVENWPVALPPGGLATRVMARIAAPPAAIARRPSLGFAALAAGLAAMLLVVAAFWHPERKWLEEDKYFTRFDHGGPGAPGITHQENFYE